jgi:DNA repair exonuclease SbcCD nuclease subunit
MDEFRFVHAADLHLDTPFTGVGLTSPSVSVALRDASLRVWDALVRLTIESRAECLLLSGGLYDGPELGLRAPLALRDGLQTLAERHVPVFIVLGGRDPIDVWGAGFDWPSNVTIFDSSGTSVPLRREGRHLATLHGLSHPADDAAQRLRGMFGPAGSSPLHIGLLHGAVGSGDESSPCAHVSLEELRRLPVDYWALGHEHARRYVSEDPWIVYPGTPQGRVAMDHDDAFGAIVAEVAGGEVRQISFEALDVVRFRSVEIEADRLERTELLRKALDRVEALRRENGGRALLLEIRLKRRASRIDELDVWLESELRARTEDWNPFVWWTSAGDRTVREPLRSTVRHESEIGSLLLDRSEALQGAVLPRSSFLARELEPLRRAWDAELDLEEAKGLIRDATSLALGELAERTIE